MVVVLVVAAGAAWESPVLELVGGRPGMVVLKRCVDVDDLLAAGSAGQADAAVVALDAPGLDPAAVDLLHRHQVRVVAVAGRDDEAARTRAARIGVDALVGHDDLRRAARRCSRPTATTRRTDDALLATTEARSARRAASGRVVVVWGPAGAPGRTTVAAGARRDARRGAGCAPRWWTPTPTAASVAQQLGVLDEVSGLLSAARLTGDGALEARLRLGAARAGRPPDRRHRAAARRPVGRGARRRRASTCSRSRGRLGHVVVDTGFSLEDDPAATSSPARRATS